MNKKICAIVAAATMSAFSMTSAQASGDSMAFGENGYKVTPILTVGETLRGTKGVLNPSSAGDYTPPGVIDGLGAYRHDKHTVRVFANHELLNFRGYPYEVSNGQGGTFSLIGARVSYFDIDVRTRKITDAGLAYNKIYDANGNIARDASIFSNDFSGFSRFCSSALFKKGEYNLADTIYFTGEEDGGFFNPVGGAEWALDVKTGDIWQLPALGRGAWENVTLLETGKKNQVALLLADDSSPFDFDGDDVNEAAPLFLYVGTKNPKGDFPARNGLRDGKLYVFVADNGATSPLDFNTKGTLKGSWVEVDNSPQPDKGSEDGATGFDEYGYPTQGNLWLQARDLGAFGFSRPEDVATNPYYGKQAVLASTGVDTYAVDPETGNGADTFGTMYIVTTNFYKMRAKVRILYDGDADPQRKLRSPDNLDWADNGFIYVQEDEAEEDSLTGEVLFGDGAANPNEASIVKMDPYKGRIKRVAQIDRSIVLDPTTTGTPVDEDAGDAGEWETSGILDVSKLFGKRRGTLFLFDVQAHGIADQEEVNADSRINDGDLVEGGQLLFLEKKPRKHYYYKKY